MSRFGKSIPLSTASQPAVVARWGTAFRAGELLLLGYFTYVAVLAMAEHRALGYRLAATGMPLLVSALAVAETRHGQKWSSFLRDWVPLPLVLIAYWQVNWFDSAPLVARQLQWVAWDRVILHQFGLHAAVESLGPVIPAVLEFCYLMLYVIPFMCLAALHLTGRRQRVDRFYQILLGGTLLAYALLPHFPSLPPRLAFPAENMPLYAGIFRKINLWVLDHLDIATSVFPSGHVAVAFSSAFGLRRALPERPGLSRAAFAAALLVFVATVYGRYHYAADGLASMAIVACVWGLHEMLEVHA
ncbi:MAG: phosphatase PAP2 family protein [Acidobacteria bacterium]|nr:phosphatase PAP2 family protein [Acidobacteriota bacterium]